MIGAVIGVFVGMSAIIAAFSLMLWGAKKDAEMKRQADEKRIHKLEIQVELLKDQLKDL